MIGLDYDWKSIILITIAKRLLTLKTFVNKIVLNNNVHVKQ